ncbi:non-specific lipid-transfer protein-like isoform X1 [Hibiscus syriacus]|uniref:Non-specific lipid-transfer protein-like isoform X1 n=1 Tax=Hibiscus syriacus TaxID=106335 RepID=A0A6A3B9N0_HIBSY|nr:non-specific lipid-transfer protein-like isoform X1 [Hibiscus syriacus]
MESMICMNSSCGAAITHQWNKGWPLQSGGFAHLCYPCGLKSAIVPLFEKVLSASDSGRIGRLVLPKACAETYFPAISQSEGLPLRIQDVNGKEWTFQFRFWPNNNSRMCLNVVFMPCQGLVSSISTNSLDVPSVFFIIFSRIDPGGNLIMGFRKATNSDTQVKLRADFSESFLKIFKLIENLSPVSTYSQIPKEGKDLHVNALSEHWGVPDGNVSLGRDENHGHGEHGNSVQQFVVNGEKKRSRNIGSKSKRLLMHSVDALELRFT